MAFDLPFSPKTPPLIGLDIGSSSVKIVELSEAGKGVMRLERYAIEPLPRGAVVDGNIDKIEVVADAVKRAWRKAGGKVRNAAMALPASAVITKRIALPANLREEELEMQVIVLDDGFQHRRLARNLDIVLLDASDPFGYGYLLPRGLLRESPRSLRRAARAMPRDFRARPTLFRIELVGPSSAELRLPAFATLHLSPSRRS